jgi:ligand-binding sensor domain-containing protein/serine phosphatase RsbU (regulator of sigma subunit)
MNSTLQLKGRSVGIALKHLSAIFLFAAAALFIPRQSAASELKFSTISLRDGLPDNTVKCLFEDGAGFMWIGTKNGLARYDGARMKIFKNIPSSRNSLPDNFVYCISQLPDGRLAIGGANGSISFLSAGLDFDRDASEALAAGYASRAAVSAIAQSADGAVWFSSLGDGVFRYMPSSGELLQFHPQSTERKILSGNVSSIASIDGKIWLVSDAGIVEIIDPASLEVSQLAAYSKPVPFISFGSKLAQSASGAIWLSTESSGIFVKEPGRASFNKLGCSYLNKLPFLVTDIAPIGDTLLAVSTDGGGLVTVRLPCSSPSAAVHDPNFDNTIANNALWCVLATSSHIWAGSFAKGLSAAKLGTGDVKIFNRRSPGGAVLKDNSILAAEPLGQGKYLVSTDGGGLYTYCSSSMELAPYDTVSKELSVVKYMETYRGAILCGTYANGLQIIGNTGLAGIQDLADSLDGKSVWSIEADIDGRLWCGTLYNGLYCLDKGKVYRYFYSDTAKAGLPANMINALAADHMGRMWVGTDGGGAGYIENGAFYRYTGWENFKTVAYSINISPSGQATIAYKNFGADIISIPADGQPYLVSSIFSSISIKSLCQCASGYNWLATENEIMQLTASFELQKIWGTREGITSDGFNTNAMSCSGELVIAGSVSGLAAVYRSAEQGKAAEGLNAPALHVVEFYRADIRMTETPRSWYFNHLDTVRLSYLDINVSFRLLMQGGVFAPGDAEYRIPGMVDDWTDAGAGLSVQLPFMVGGEHELQLRTRLGYDYSPVYIVNLSVDRPFWQKQWFIALLASLLVISVFSAFAFRDFAHKRLELRLLKKVEERTVFIRGQNEKLEQSSQQLSDNNQMLLNQKKTLEEQKALLDTSHAELNSRNTMLEKQRLELELANKSLVEQQLEIAAQSEKIKEKNSLLTKSLNYAKRIQDSLFPSPASVARLLPDSFMFFKPRDIVSGDFFWMKESAGKIVVAEVDCTGHGVPGAFMSMIGNALLNEIVVNRGVLEPSEIFYALNNELMRIFSLGDFDAEAQDDGMDLSIGVIDIKNGCMKFASAMQHVFVIPAKGKAQVYNGDIFSIGGLMARFKTPVYTSHFVSLEKGSMYVFASDGFIDQFGGIPSEKYGVDRFVELLEKTREMPSHEISGFISNNYSAWIGSKQQLDDILVFGFRI